MEATIWRGRSRLHRTAHTFNDAILRCDVEIRMHGKADNLLRDPFTHWQTALKDGIGAICPLLVHWLLVVDHRRDTHSTKNPRELLAVYAIGQLYRILRPNRGGAFGNSRYCHHIGKCAAVPVCNNISSVHFVIEYP